MMATMRKQVLFFAILFAVLLALASSVQADAQGSRYDRLKGRSQTRVSSLKERGERKYENLRDRANREYAAMLEKAWEKCEALGARPLPQEEEEIVPVVVTPEEDRERVIEDRATPVEEVIPVVKPRPQPVPIAPVEVEPVVPPIEEVPVPEVEPEVVVPNEEEPPVVVPIEREGPKPEKEEYLSFNFFNTPLRVRLSEGERFSLGGTSGKEVSAAWTKLSGAEYNGVLADCLAIRGEYKLCDWAYLLMLRDLSQAYFGGPCDEATLLTAFLYCQSGYTMRLARSKNSLVLLYASEHEIYGKRYWMREGQHLYALDGDPSTVNICQAKFPKESPLSLIIAHEPELSFKRSEARSLVSKRRRVTAEVSVNESLIEFYQTYPSSMINDDFGTRWAMYANTPLSKEARESLYPALEKAIEGLSPTEATDRLLNFVQTAFVYEYDDKVWGYDRAFFAEESLYYPYIDCEDRAILFTRLVRDLVGLEAVLVFYPGHLASAVCFPEDVPGDYVSLGGKRYTVCDPTILGVGAPIGVTMAGMDNSKAKVILLD